jgi:hypothetical protein
MRLHTGLISNLGAGLRAASHHHNFVLAAGFSLSSLSLAYCAFCGISFFKLKPLLRSTI